jgi:uncharacterized RDD family membrane protein YckC
MRFKNATIYLSQNQQMETYNQDILQDLEVNLAQASTGKRLANYLIDLVVFYIFFFIFTFLVAFTNPETLNDLDTESSGFGLVDRLITMVMYGLYMFLIELLFKGKSLGKLITGTRAVNEDGSALTLKGAFIRGISRSVPFDALSALGTPSYPWHDKWANTYVIDESQSNIIK